MIDISDGESLRSGFLRSVEHYPSAPALAMGERRWTYAELAHSARAWAGAILDHSRQPPRRVGVFAYRSEVSYAGVLAALFSGAAFVPLNPRFPTERTRHMVRVAELDALIVDSAAAAQLEAVLKDLDPQPLVIAPSEDAGRWPGLDARIVARADLAERQPLAELPPVTASDIAYLLFTSGSTGVPKGVPVAHTNVLYFLRVMSRRYGLGSADRVSQTFDQTFDLSVFDLFLAWGAGACVCVPQPIDLVAPVAFVRKHGLTLWFSVPSILALMRKKGLLKPGSLPSLRWSLFCGEPLPRAAAEAWQAAAPNSIVENLYGPTELTIACCVYRWDLKTSSDQCVNDVVPIGRPYPGLGAVVVDESLSPVAESATGELCICGPQTVPGYWRDPAKTAERFVTLPAADSSGLCFYRTGDRVMRLASGDYVYLGRTDHQVKVMGYRVELAEIEAVLRQQPGVHEAVALGWPVESGTAEGILAFVSGAQLDPVALKAAAGQKLTDYMTPKAIVVLDEFPLNANGKIDRKALSQALDSGQLAAAD